MKFNPTGSPIDNVEMVVWLEGVKWMGGGQHEVGSDDFDTDGGLEEE